MESSTSSSTGSSFVLVDSTTGPPQDPSALLSSLAPYFPSIGDPSAFPWDYSRVQQVRQTRHLQPDGRLFIDDLLALLGIDGPSEYPPPAVSSFNALLFQLLSSPSTLQAHCIIFYLLLASPSSPSPSPLPTQFARAFLLPTGFVRGIQGFHALDAGNYRAAVASLTDPHLTPDFVPKTLAVLGHLPEVKERAQLVLSFWRLSGIDLERVDEAEIVVGALCDQERKFGVVEAWALQRKWDNEEESKRLAIKVLSSCFGDNALTTPVPHHLQALLSHPFTPAEDTLVTAFCLSPPSPLISSTLTADWRLSKLIAEGRALDALRFWSKAKAKKDSSGGIKGSDERERLLRAIHATLTEVQRNELALEADDFSSSTFSPSSQSEPQKSNIAQPAWAPLPPSLPTPSTPSRGARLVLPSRPSPSKPHQPQSTELPLSASPFLRREKPLVSSSDGGVLGGVQKSVLRAMREAEIATPEKKREQSIVGSPFASLQQQQTQSPARNGNLYPSLVASPARKPTLSGFGSVRLPQVQSYGKARVDEGQQSLFASVGGKQRWDSEGPLPAAGSEMEMDVEVERQQEAEGPIVTERQYRVDGEEESTFGFRAAQDPKIAATIAAASKSSPPPSSKNLTHGPPSTSSKRRSRPSTSSDAKKGGEKGEKRRALSTEPEDRGPTSSVSVSQQQPKKPPGAFPSTTTDDDEDDHDDEEEASRSSTRKARTSTRRSARASSVSASGAAPSTPRASNKSTTSKKPSAQAAEMTPQPTRRSSRLRTPAKVGGGDDFVTFEEVEGRRKAARGGGGRGRIEEEEE